jgi:flagellar protein FlgJ
MRAAVEDVSAQFALDTNALGRLKQQAKSDPKQALAAAAGQFEALFMQMLLKSMREALPQDGPLASETGKTYTAMFDQQIAQQLAKKGVGLADMLVKQMTGPVLQPPGPAGTAVPLAMPERSPGTRAVRIPATSLVPPPANGAGKTTLGSAPASVAATVQGFVDRVRPYAEAAAQKLGVPAHYLIAQAGLESGWGKSQPRTADGAPSHNLFGIKATGPWKGASVTAGTTEYAAGKPETTTAAFRAYASYTDSFQDFAKLLQNSRRYATALANTHDAGKYAASLQQAGYATDPRYAEKLTRAIQVVARYAPLSPAPVQVVAADADSLRGVA